MNITIGEKLKELRILSGIPMEIILKKLNMSKSTYLRMEKGKTVSWTNNIEKICALYNIEVEELLLPIHKYKLLTDHQVGVLANSSVIENLSNKEVELYERLLLEKDKLIDELRSKLKK